MGIDTEFLNGTVVAPDWLQETNDHKENKNFDHLIPMEDTGVANAYVVTFPHAPAAYAEGMIAVFKAVHANTGASTLKCNTLAALAITLEDGSALPAGFIPAGAIVPVMHNGTCFQVISLGLAAHLPDTAAGIHGSATAATAGKLAHRDASGYLWAKNRACEADGVWSTNEYFGESVGVGGTLTTVLVVATATRYLVFAGLQTGTDVGDVGIYSVARVGTTTIIDTIVAATGVTVSLDGSYHIVGTYASAGTGRLSAIRI